MSRRTLAFCFDCASAFLWIFVALVVAARPAYAYVDPGSGLLVFQVLGSTFLGFVFLVRNRIRTAIARLAGARNKDSDDASLR